MLKEINKNVKNKNIIINIRYQNIFSAPGLCSQ